MKLVPVISTISQDKMINMPAYAFFRFCLSFHQPQWLLHAVMGVLADLISLSIVLNIDSQLEVLYLTVIVFPVSGNLVHFFPLRGYFSALIITQGTSIITIQQLLFVHGGC